MMLDDIGRIEHGHVIVKRKFAFLPRTVFDKKKQVRIWFSTYYEKRKYVVLIADIIEGWEITDHLHDPRVSNLRVIK